MLRVTCKTDLHFRNSSEGNDTCTDDIASNLYFYMAFI